MPLRFFSRTTHCREGTITYFAEPRRVVGRFSALCFVASYVKILFYCHSYSDHCSVACVSEAVSRVAQCGVEWMKCLCVGAFVVTLQRQAKSITLLWNSDRGAVTMAREKPGLTQ